MTRSDQSFEIDKRFVALIDDRLFKPAEHDYLASRLLYANGMYRNFLWCALQALEKFCKSALLLRNKRAHSGHNISKLLRNLVDSGLVNSIPDVPSQFGHLIDQMKFDTPSIQETFDRINIQGSTLSRYAQSDIDWTINDLISYDFAIKWVRQQSLCLPLETPDIDTTFLCFNNRSSIKTDRFPLEVQHALKWNNFAFFEEDPQVGLGAAILNFASPHHRSEIESGPGYLRMYAIQAENRFNTLLFKNPKILS